MFELKGSRLLQHLNILRVLSARVALFLLLELKDLALDLS